MPSNNIKPNAARTPMNEEKRAEKINHKAQSKLCFFPPT